jgi:hypothetical protein
MFSGSKTHTSDEETGKGGETVEIGRVNLCGLPVPSHQTHPPDGKAQQNSMSAQPQVLGSNTASFACPQSQTVVEPEPMLLSLKACGA